MMSDRMMISRSSKDGCVIEVLRLESRQLLILKQLLLLKQLRELGRLAD